jgi:hypothetical protein
MSFSARKAPRGLEAGGFFEYEPQRPESSINPWGAASAMIDI